MSIKLTSCFHELIFSSLSGGMFDAIKSKGLRNSLKVIVGGAPLDAAFAEKIGADGYGKDAAEAVKLARSFFSEN